MSGAELTGLHGLSQQYNDNDIDLLVRGGVTPLESVAGVVSVVRGITTRTTTGESPDTTWRELSTILKYRAEPGGHPLPGDSGAGEQAEPGDHHRL